MSCLCSTFPGFCLARGPLRWCCPSHLSLLPPEGDLKPWCFPGARQGVRGLREAGLLRAGFQPAPDPECFGDAGASSDGGCRTPSHQSVSSAESSSPEPLVPPGSQRSGSLHWASLGDHGFVCPRTQPAPRDRHAGHSLALPELASLPSCLGTHQHHSSHALERGRSNICPRLFLQLALLQLQC